VTRSQWYESVMSATRLGGVLAAGGFAVTAELGPPRDPDAAFVRAAGRALRDHVTAVNVTDNPAATVKMSPVACAALLLDEGLEPILQLTSRDRNLMALQAELLGAWALGVRSVLALGGDPIEVGPYEGRAAEVRDVDAAGLARVICGLNDGRLAAGEPLEIPTGFLIIGAANPLVDAPDRLRAKIDAGVSVLQSNIVYDVERFTRWLGPVVDAGITAAAPMLVGVTPPRSERALRYMHDRIPGVAVDDATFARMRGLDGPRARDEGIAIAAEIIARLREIPEVAGVHLMAPGWEVEAVPRVVALAADALGPSPAGR
jgi:5,10-methylenetetrahydrofolate reductase